MKRIRVYVYEKRAQCSLQQSCSLQHSLKSSVLNASSFNIYQPPFILLHVNEKEASILLHAGLHAVEENSLQSGGSGRNKLNSQQHRSEMRGRGSSSKHILNADINSHP